MLINQSYKLSLIVFFVSLDLELGAVRISIERIFNLAMTIVIDTISTDE